MILNKNDSDFTCELSFCSSRKYWKKTASIVIEMIEYTESVKKVQESTEFLLSMLILLILNSVFNFIWKYGDYYLLFYKGVSL